METIDECFDCKADALNSCPETKGICCLQSSYNRKLYTEPYFFPIRSICAKSEHSVKMCHSIKRIEKWNLSEALQIHYGLWILSFSSFFYYSIARK